MTHSEAYHNHWSQHGKGFDAQEIERQREVRRQNRVGATLNRIATTRTDYREGRIPARQFAYEMMTYTKTLSEDGVFDGYHSDDIPEPEPPVHPLDFEDTEAACFIHESLNLNDFRR